MEKYIDPKTLARVKDMPLIAKTVAEGFLHGLHSSRQRGVGIEFNQYRAYEPGDELSRIDWKLFARSDRYFVREAERESEIQVWFLLDASESMKQMSLSNQASDWNKLEYAKHLIASLSYIAQKQGDLIGLIGMSKRHLSFLPAGNGERHWQKLLRELVRIESNESFPSLDLIRNYIERLQKPSLVFVLSDFYQREDEITRVIKKLGSGLSEVVALQMVCEDEMNFNYKGAVRFKDLETHEEVLVSAGAARDSYLKALDDYQKQLKDKLLKSQINCSSVNIDQPLDYACYEYLKQRQRVSW
ncbi:DUF58 domain-containing protein [Aliikangiella marina]|uniref:DUF58 domain-containing protein n=1 Tax=Aliikangiella marina TaxID=1712262 RepID=A0A545T5B7_9GAMM|nr:DUF58 domain-containing protein [Aliikangiella marina]TQV72409.1 DUF58 domain-containing protein [Aliikangiella marina]